MVFMIPETDRSIFQRQTNIISKRILCKGNQFLILDFFHCIIRCYLTCFSAVKSQYITEQMFSAFRIKRIFFRAGFVVFYYESLQLLRNSNVVLLLKLFESRGIY